MNVTEEREKRFQRKPLTGLELSFVIPVFFNQTNADVLTELLREYEMYDPELMRKIQFVIVDDCSPVKITIPEDIRLNYTLLRITTDISWNQAGARNLGVVKAACPKLVLTDCDHLFPEGLLQKIVGSAFPHKLYKFKRVDAEGKKKNSACNIFYTSKAVFFTTLGYDEEFCGYYGYEDVMFREFQRRMGNKLRYFTRRIPIVSTDIDRDHSYHSLVRDTSRNLELMNRKLALLKGEHPFDAHSRLFLNFDFKTVAEHLLDSGESR